MRTPTSRRQFLTGALAGAAALSSAACGRHPALDALDGPPNFLVYMPDSLRADSLGCYGGVSNCSPTVDALARRSFVFENCYAQSCWTKPSVASIFTGMTPRVHKSAATPWRADEGVEVAPRMLREQFTTWAESMERLGYRTACFQSNPHPREAFGYDRGFDDFHYELDNRATSQALEVRQWLRANGDEPFFAFVHQIDPHGPYKPSAADFLDAHGEPRHVAAESVPREDLARISEWNHSYIPDNDEAATQARAGLSDLAPEGLRFLRMLYEAQIRRADRALAQMLEQLESQGQLDRTVIVFLSDHGEAFGEHGLFAHGNWLYLEELRVPMIIHLPSQRQGVRVPDLTALYDVNPTCLALAGGQPSPDMMAKPLLDDSGTLIMPPERTVVAELDWTLPDGEYWSATLVHGTHALMRRQGWGWDAVLEGFDLSVDPLQRQPIPLDALEAEPAWQPTMALWEDTIAKHRRLAAESGPPEFAAIPEEYRQELEALGYV